MRPARVRVRTSSEGVGGVECAADRWVPSAMAQDTQDHDQDAEPPTPDGTEPDTEQLRPGSEPASDPDPDPDAGTDAHQEDA